MASSEAMTSSTHSFAYSYGLVKKCFLKICETSKFHNFLIFQPIFIRFSLFCSENFTLSSEIKLDQLRTSPLSWRGPRHCLTTCALENKLLNQNCWSWYHFSQEKLPRTLIPVIASIYCGKYAVPFFSGPPCIVMTSFRGQLVIKATGSRFANAALKWRRDVPFNSLAKAYLHFKTRFIYLVSFSFGKLK